MRVVMVTWLFLFAILLAGCVNKNLEFFSDEGMDFAFYNRIAILPLENNSEDEFSDERLAAILSTLVLNQGLFSIVEKGDLKVFFSEEVAGRDVTFLDKETSGQLAKNLKVEAYIVGSVDSYQIVRNGSYSYPVVSATLRMVDAKTGSIVWQAHGSESGYNSWQRIFGLASENIHQVSLRLVKNLLQTMK